MNKEIEDCRTAVWPPSQRLVSARSRKKNVGSSWSPWAVRLSHICKLFDLLLNSACWSPCILPWLRPWGFMCLLLSSFSPSEVKLFLSMVVVVLIQVSVDHNLSAHCSICCWAKLLLLPGDQGLPAPSHLEGRCHFPSLPFLSHTCPADGSCWLGSWYLKALDP